MSSNNEYLGKAANEASKTFIIKVISYVIAFLSQILFANMLGSDLLGLYQTCMNIVMMLLMISVFGMDSANIRFISQHNNNGEKGKIKSYFWYSIKMTTIFSLICSLVLIIFRSYIAENIFNESRLINILPVFGFVLITYSLIEVIGGYSRGIKSSSDYFLSQEFINKIVKVDIFVLLYLVNFRLFGLIIGTILGFIASLVYLFIRVRKSSSFLFNRDIHKEEIDKKQFWRYSFSMSVVYFTNYLMLYVNSTIVGMFLTSSEVGIYSNAQTLSSFIIFIYVSFNSIFVSMVSELYYNKEYELLNKLYIDITRIILVLSIPIVLVMVFYSKSILSIFGGEFVGGSTALIILVIGQLANIIVGPNESLLSMSGNQRYSMMNGVVIAFVNISLNFILIPKVGIVGSAIAGAIAVFTGNLLKTIQVKKVMNMVPYDKSIYKVVVVIVIDTIILILSRMLFKDTFIMAAIVGVTVYIMSLLIYYKLGLTESELSLMQSLINKIKK